MSRIFPEKMKTWPRNLSTSQGGGMSTSSTNVYQSNIPPCPVFVRELESRGYNSEAKFIRRYLPEFLWPENFFK
ncbi:hypothetical protein ABE82_26185 (plasmid) [Paenibacillus peoriae]|nr:hypothetical protein ABE82_26185 [Paenibacillus peoriae]